jgi:hypothetical protein
LPPLRDNEKSAANSIACPAHTEAIIVDPKPKTGPKFDADDILAIIATL